MRIPLPLSTRAFGKSRDFIPVVDSTNTEARRHAVEGAPNGHLVWADRQRAGRGRAGRSWDSPAGLNLLFSVVVRPDRPAAEWPQLTLVAAVALIDALRPHFEGAPRQPTIKWPNDLRVGERKLAGLLTEAEPDAGFAVVGVGLNVNASESDFPEAIRPTATSMRIETGREFDRDALLADTLTALEDWFEEWNGHGFAAAREAWLARWGMAGVRVRTGDAPPVEGKMIGLDERGRLLIEDAAGALHPVVAGEVTPWPGA